MEFNRFENYGFGPVAVFSVFDGSEMKLDKASLTARIDNLKNYPQVNVDAEMAALAQITADERLMGSPKTPNVAGNRLAEGKSG